MVFGCAHGRFQVGDQVVELDLGGRAIGDAEQVGGMDRGKSIVPLGSRDGRPRSDDTVAAWPVTERSAVAPSATITTGWTNFRSRSSHQRQISISGPVGTSVKPFSRPAARS